MTDREAEYEAMELLTDDADDADMGRMQRVPKGWDCIEGDTSGLGADEHEQLGHELLQVRTDIEYAVRQIVNYNDTIRAVDALERVLARL